MSSYLQPNCQRKKQSSKPHQSTFTSAFEAQPLKEPALLFDNILSPLNYISCDICGKQITQSAHILCSKRDLCVVCFANLKSFPPIYHAIGKLNFPLFDSKWAALEEILLFTAIEKCGYGNWSEIKEQMGGSKNIEQLKQHYELLFSKFDESYPMVITEKDSNGLIIRNDLMTSTQSEKFKKKVLINEWKMLKKTAQMTEMRQDSFKIMNYQPKRGEFEVQYDNDLELLIAEMQFLDSDSQEETNMKYEVLDIFCERLNQRNMIKDFAIERKLLDLSELHRLDRKRTKEEREIASMLQPFARFNSPTNHEILINQLARERQLRQEMSNMMQRKLKGFAKASDSNSSTQRSHSNSFSSHQHLASNIPIDDHQKDKRRKKNQKNGQKIECINSEEYELCQKLGINQISFVLIKKTIKSHIAQRKVTSVESFYTIFKLDRILIDEIFSFLMQNTKAA